MSARILLLAALLGPSVASAQRGVPQNGFPVWQERMLQVLFNRSRAEPTADPKACSSTTVRPPLVYQYNFNRSARFHSSNLRQAGCFQHNSPCLLQSDISTRYLPNGSCDGAPSCACTNTPTCDSACTSATCTQTFTRIAMFGSSGSGEIIAGGYGSPRSAHTGWMNSSGHCSIILGGGGSVGTGWYNNYWTGNFGSGTPSGTLIAGGHEVGTSRGQFTGTTQQDVELRVNYYHTGGGPQSAEVNIDGTCTTMTLERGGLINGTLNGTFLATVPMTGTQCRRYVFRFRDPSGNVVLLPEAGSYGVGGSLSACPDWTSATPATCGSSNAPPTVATAASATPNPVSGTTTVLSVLGADDGGEANLTYTWSASGPAAVTYSANGTNAAKSSTVTFIRAGSYAFTVTLRDGGGLTVTSTVNVTVGATLTTIAVSPATANVLANGTQQFTATAQDQFGQSLSPAPTYAWTVTGGGSIDASGLFTAGTTSGTFQVEASSGGKTGAASVTVSAGAPPTVATAASASPNPVSGATTALSVLGADDGGEANLTYTWSASGPAAVTYSANGTNAAKNSTATFIRAGGYAFTVTLRDGGGLTATSSVNVTVNQTLTTIVVSPATASVLANGTRQFTAAAQDQFGQGISPAPSFSWTVSGGGSIDGSGLFTAGAAPGTFQVTASSGGRSGTATVTVSLGAPPTVATAASATPNPVSGTTTQLSVLGADDGGEANLTYTWASSGPAAVTFSPNGTNAARSSTATFSAAGTYTLTVTIQDATGQSVTSTVTVTVSQALTAIEVTPSAVTVQPSGTQQFTATARDQFGAAMAATIAWTVSGGGSIDAAGLFTAGAAPGGPHTVTASSGGRSGTAQVTIAAGSPPTITTAASATPNPTGGTTTQLSVLGADDGGEANLTYSWSASGPAAVSFSANASNAAKSSTATFSAAGSYSFQVVVRDAQGLTASSSVTVQVTQSVQQVRVTPSSATVAPGGSQQFAAAAEDQFGGSLSPQPSFTWTVSGGGAVDGSGRFTAGSAPGGPFTVAAEAGGVTGTATVTVSGQPPDTTPPQISLTRPSEGQNVSGLVQLEATATDDVGVARVEFLVDGVLLGSTTGAPYSREWDASAAGLGEKRLQARAVDLSGNEALSAAVRVTVVADGSDVTPPTVRLVTPESGAQVVGWVEAVAEAEDDVGVVEVRFELDGAPLGTAAVPPWTTRFSTLGLSEGEHALVAVARDAAGNVGRSEPVTLVSVDSGDAVGGCGCTAGGFGAPLLVLALLGMSRRRRPRV